MKKANHSLFVPRGLTAKIMTTKKMMAAVEFTDTAANGKLKLPPLNSLEDLELGIQPTSPTFPAFRTSRPLSIASISSQQLKKPEDPRVRRLQALASYISPLTFDVGEQVPKGWITKVGNAPLQWANGRQMKKLDKAHAKSVKAREGKSDDVEREIRKSQVAVDNIDARILHLSNRSNAGNSDVGMTDGINRGGAWPGETEDEVHELKMLETQKTNELDGARKAVEEIHRKGDKKLEKVYKQEEKIANRILWIVIERSDGTGGGEYLQVEE